MDHNTSGSSVHRVLQARTLEWVATPFSRDLPNPGIEPGSPVLQTDLYHPSHQRSPHRFLVWLILESKVRNRKKTKFWDKSKQKTFLSISKQVKLEKQKDVLLMKTPGFVSLRAQEGCSGEAEPGRQDVWDTEPDSTAPAFPAWTVPRVARRAKRRGGIQPRGAGTCLQTAGTHTCSNVTKASWLFYM